MKKLISLLLLLAAAPSVFADNVLYPDAISKATDLSVNYLSQVFGTVGGVLTGGDSQLMGQLFYVLNNGILIAASIIIGYSVLMSTVRLASEGVSMAQGKSTLYTTLKLAIGVVLIIPNPSTGYSTLQSVVMKVVVEGVGLADSIWDKGLDYLNEGGMVWTKPASNASSQANLVSDPNIKALYSSGLGAKVFANEVCMYGSRDLKSSDANETNSPVAADAPTKPMYSVWADSTNHTFNFPGLDDTSSSSGSSCGSVSWDINGACDIGANPSATAQTCATARTAMESLVSGLAPLAQKFYCGNADGNPKSCQNVDLASTDYMHSSLFNSLLNYYAGIQSYATINGKSADNSKTGFISAAKQEGWLNAGRYYWDLMRFSSDAAAAQNLSTYVDANVVDHKAVSDQALSDEINKASLYINSDNSGVAIKNGQVNPDFRTYINQVYGQAQGSGVAESDDSAGGILGGAAVGVIGPAFMNPGVGATLTTAVAGINGISMMFDHPNSNPIKFLYDLGQACLNITIAIWVVGGVAIGGTMLGFGICQASSPLAVMGQTVASWFLPMLSMIAVQLWVAGFFLSYYVPLYPFMIFLFASIGWFISVIEAMVAAPLVALGLTHPENHDLLGKAEQAVVLLLGVFIQPSLLVIGLIGAIIFSFVAFQLLIYTYSGFVSDIMSSTAGAYHSSNILAAAQHSPLYSGSILLSQPLLLIVFCTITYTLLTQSFSLVFVLRDNVMRWIGAPGSGLQSPEQLVQESKGAIMSMGKATGEASSRGIEQGSQASSKIGEAMRKEDDKEKGNSAEASGGGGGGGGG